MDNIYAFSDRVLQQRIGNNLKNARLKQNITQQSLAEKVDISMQKKWYLAAGHRGNGYGLTDMIAVKRKDYK